MFRNWKVESMRHLLLALFGAVLGLGALAARRRPRPRASRSRSAGPAITGPSTAGPRSIPAGPPYRPYRRHYYRPAYYGRTCRPAHRYCAAGLLRAALSSRWTGRAWDGYGWVDAARRICR